MEISWDTSQLTAYTAKLGTAAVKLARGAEVEVGKAGDESLAMARELVPVREGTLSNSLALRKEGLRVSVTAETDYEGFVEHGTSKMPPQPYMAPTLEAQGPKLQSALVKLLGGIL